MDREKTKPAKEIFNSKFVAFGDSITQGVGVPEGVPKWTEVIRDRFNLVLINSGVGGDTSSQGLMRIDRDVLAHRPDFVTICFGMNDHCMISPEKPRVSTMLFRDNIIEMIECIRLVDAIPLLITPNYIIEGSDTGYYYSRHNLELYKHLGGAQAWLDRYIDIIRDIALMESAGIIDIRKECEKYDPYEFLRTLKNDKFSDGVHPHTLGASVYAQMIGDYLENEFSYYE